MFLSTDRQSETVDIDRYRSIVKHTECSRIYFLQPRYKLNEILFKG